MVEVDAHCAGQVTRNEVPADGSGPSKASAVSAHVATNALALGENLRPNAAAAGEADEVLWTPVLDKTM